MGKFLEHARQQLAARDFLVYPSGISIEGPMAMWPAEEAIGPFLDLAKSLGRRLVYLTAHVLQPADLIDSVATLLSEVDEAVDAPTPEEFLSHIGVASYPAVKSYLRYGKEHYGEVLSVRVEWVHDGVVHRLWKYADWHKTFMDKATEVADLIEEPEATLT
jgi:hypothetical protein